MGLSAVLIRLVTTTHWRYIMTDRFVEIKSSNVNGIFKVLANKGITWLVEDEDGSSFQVQKRLVVRGPWEESEEAAPTDPEEAAPVISIAAQLEAAASSATATPTDPEAESDTPMITLKQLCFDLDVEPRIARRRLRNSPFGKVGIGHRWEWEAGSTTLAQVTAVILATKPVQPE